MNDILEEWSNTIAHIRMKTSPPKNVPDSIANARTSRMMATVLSSEHKRLVKESGVRDPRRILTALEELALLKKISHDATREDQIAIFEWITGTRYRFELTTYIDILIKSRSKE
jgi:hypothetical protein